MENKTTEAQKDAIKAYRKRNPEKTRYYSYRSTARTFINNYSKEEDLKEFEELIKKRREVLKKTSD